MPKRTAAVAVLTAPLLLQSAGALERAVRLDALETQESWLATGLEYERGDYESPDTTSVWRVPVQFGWRRGDVSITAAVPFLYAQSDGAITVSTATTGKRRGNNAQPATQTGSESASGIGDIELAASYHLPADYRRELAYRMTGIVKLGTASSSDGLGTGENDFALEGGAVRGFDEFLVSAALGYEFNGDADNIDYDDVFYGSLGGAMQLRGKRRAGATLYASESVISGADDPLEITLFYQQPVSATRDLYLYLVRGLSDASPDILL
ncbi:MAG: transporter, partial [Thiogranum sp.]|nr:transporter [Thiogranum sp.]